MTSGEWIQMSAVVVLALTLGAVLWYACEARKQAKASNAIARSAFRPVLVISDYAVKSLELGGTKYARFLFQIRNDGPGPALNVRVFLRSQGGQELDLATEGPIVSAEFGFLSARQERTYEYREKPDNWFPEGKRADLVIRYHDVAKVEWESLYRFRWGDITVLEITLLSVSEHPVDERSTP